MKDINFKTMLSSSTSGLTLTKILSRLGSKFSSVVFVSKRISHILEYFLRILLPKLSDENNFNYLNILYQNSRPFSSAIKIVHTYLSNSFIQKPRSLKHHARRFCQTVFERSPLSCLESNG